MKSMVAAVVATTVTALSFAGCSSGRGTVHPNEELLRRGYEAFNSKDMRTVFGLFADDISLIVPGRSPQAGTFKGKAKVQRYFSMVGEHTAGTHRVHILHALTDDTRAFLLVRALGQHEDKVLDMPVLHLWRLSNGKVTELSLVPTDQYAFDEFWS